MQTLLLKIDDKHLPSVINLLKPYSENECQYRIIDEKVESELIEENLAYQEALNDLVNDKAMEFNTYLANRGII